MTVLVHIGYHKTGTNWLQRLLFSDPETGYRWLGKRPSSHPVRRIVRDRPFEFDAAAVRAAFEPMVRDAEEAGLLPVVSLERLSGHPLSGGYDGWEIAGRIRAVFPEARVLAVVREQRSAVVSMYKGYVQQGAAGTIDDFLRPPTSRSERVPLFNRRYFEYDQLIAHYRELFGSENVHALAFDQFVEDGRGFIAGIGEFAGRPIPAGVLDRLPYTQRENARTASALTLSLTRLLNHLGPPTELNPTPPVRSKAVRGLARRMEESDALNGRLTRRLAARREADLRAAVDRWAGKKFAGSNRRLERLLGVDLGAYGWTT